MTGSTIRTAAFLVNAVELACIVFFAMCLTGCASEPQLQPLPREIRIPVAVACVPADQIPAEPARIGDQLTGDAMTDVAVLAASALDLRRWGRTEHSALVGCAQVPGKP
jgi:hypothetical protein